MRELSSSWTAHQDQGPWEVINHFLWPFVTSVNKYWIFLGGWDPNLRKSRSITPINVCFFFFVFGTEGQKTNANQIKNKAPKWTLTFIHKIMTGMTSIHEVGWCAQLCHACRTGIQPPSLPFLLVSSLSSWPCCEWGWNRDLPLVIATPFPRRGLVSLRSIVYRSVFSFMLCYWKVRT